MYCDWGDDVYTWELVDNLQSCPLVVEYMQGYRVGKWARDVSALQEKGGRVERDWAPEEDDDAAMLELRTNPHFLQIQKEFHESLQSELHAMWARDGDKRRGGEIERSMGPTLLRALNLVPDAARETARVVKRKWVNSTLPVTASGVPALNVSQLPALTDSCAAAWSAPAPADPALPIVAVTELSPLQTIIRMAWKKAKSASQLLAGANPFNLSKVKVGTFDAKYYRVLADHGITAGILNIQYIFITYSIHIQ